LDGQFHRYRKIILDKNNFIQEMASLTTFMVQDRGQDRGYSLHFLAKRLHMLLHDWKGIYASTDPEILFAAIFDKILFS
jgi:hypothetical protein